MMSDVETLASQILEGSTRALARGLTWVESGGARAEALCARLYPSTGRAQIVGVTGAPGSGKSTLARALALVARARGRTVGILAVDPSSPFSGGAILGDRIRMSDLALDPGVFIRSMATRGALGGLSRAAADAVDLMDAAGLGLVLVETVGVGQDEVDVMRLAHTVIVVSVPGLGDDVQALKAGVLEIADVHVVNKADREGADRTVAELRAMLTLLPTADGAWVPPVLPAAAARDEGIEAIADALDSHVAYQKTERRARAPPPEDRHRACAPDRAGPGGRDGARRRARPGGRGARELARARGAARAGAARLRAGAPGPGGESDVDQLIGAPRPAGPQPRDGLRRARPRGKATASREGRYYGGSLIGEGDGT